ncbi:MAG: hypothetical protein EOP05_15755 [Proteobacteria bacterium]|nr:MAG: hypothetical protein EOP05_15755 [Pseudomonadota bacterium]
MSLGSNFGKSLGPLNPTLLREGLRSIRRDLSVVHKSLLDFQLRVQEGLDERRYSSADLLQLSIQHEDFEWLRLISTLMVRIDDVVDEELIEEVKHEGDEVIAELQQLFSPEVADDKRSDFKRRLEIAINKDPHLFVEVAKIRGRLHKNEDQRTI